MQDNSKDSEFGQLSNKEFQKLVGQAAGRVLDKMKNSPDYKQAVSWISNSGFDYDVDSRGDNYEFTRSGYRVNVSVPKYGLDKVAVDLHIDTPMDKEIAEAYDRDGFDIEPYTEEELKQSEENFRKAVLWLGSLNEKLESLGYAGRFYVENYDFEEPEFDGKARALGYKYEFGLSNEEELKIILKDLQDLTKSDSK